MNRLLDRRRPPLLLGLVVAIAGVAATTALLFALREIAPIVALSVVYLLAVLAGGLAAAVMGGGSGPSCGGP